jgi:hypothetical protein
LLNIGCPKRRFDKVSSSLLNQKSGKVSFGQFFERVLMPEDSLQNDLSAIAETIYSFVNRAEGDSTEILQILRFLEALHRKICDESFLTTLPNRRRTLYNLLREIETEGGWPYIPRMQLKTLLNHLDHEMNEPWEGSEF